MSIFGDILHSSYRSHEQIPDLLRGVPLRHARGQGDLEDRMTVQDLLHPGEDHLALAGAQQFGLHLHQGVPVVLEEATGHENGGGTKEMPPCTVTYC